MSQARLSEWVAGFFDGEGATQLEVAEGSAKIGYQTRPTTRINHTYVGGMFDAEGNLGLNVSEKSGHNNGLNHSVSLLARITQNDCDRLISLLNEYSDVVGFKSTVYHQVGDFNDCDQFIWNVGGAKNVRLFLESIKENTVVKRPEIDIFLGEILPRFQAGDHLNRRGFLKLMAWRDVLNSHKGGRRGKYNLGFFENLWDMKLGYEQLPEGHPRTQGFIFDADRRGESP